MAAMQVKVLLLAAISIGALSNDAGAALGSGNAALRGQAPTAPAQQQLPDSDLPAAGGSPSQPQASLRRQSVDGLASPPLEQAQSGGGSASGPPEGPPARSAPPARNLIKRAAPEVTIADVETSLMTELAGKTSEARLRDLEAALKPMYEALPKEESGHLGHQAVRYALHRLLLQRHGWFIVGLEPTDEAPPPYLNKEWVAEYLQGLLEQRLGDRGLDLKETAALAAVLEDLVRAEATRRLDLVFDLLRVPPESRMNGSEADRVLETYMMLYLDEGNFTYTDKDMSLELAVFKEGYTDWASAASWMQEIKRDQLGSASDSKLGRQEMVSVVNQLGERFSSFNDGECHSLKTTLLGMEGPRPGRVPLMDFYKKGLYSHWNFDEKIEYLRVLGALDESDAAHPSVIVPNYVGSRINCLGASTLYAVCCRNECEDLMGSLERKIAGPTASPDQIVALVSELRSDTVNASRQLSGSLVQRLRGIAERHGGQVPLHGRLFAQWMHHAYPRECPFPHESGVNPQTPDEWMKGEGQEGEARNSEAEVREIIGAGSTSGPKLRAAKPSADLPWTEAEVLLAKGPVPTATVEPSPLSSAMVDPSPGLVLAKACLSGFLLLCLGIHKSGILFDKSHGKKRMARNLDFADFDDLDDDLKKPSKTMQMWQRWAVLLGLGAVCVFLEAMGLLDRFSFGCFLVVGLLMNVVLPLLARSSSRKPKKCCE